jgi:serine phosphatase RsbU (regulator of sigma subunit)
VKPLASRRFVALIVGLAAIALAIALLVAIWRLHLRYVNGVIGFGLVCLGIVALLLLGSKLISALLFKVGRRLAFSYFLLGGLPIPMVMLLLAVISYLLASFFIGHLYRDSLRSLDADVAVATQQRAALFLGTGRPAAPAAGREMGEPPASMTYAYYQDGRRLAGDDRAPAHWPGWATGSPTAGGAANAASPGAAQAERPAARGGSAPPAATGTAEAEAAATGEAGAPPLPRFIARQDRSPTLACAAGTARRGVIGIYAGDLDKELSQRSGLWVETNRPDDPDDAMHISLGGHELPPLTPRPSRNFGEAQKFFKQRSHGDWFWDRQMLSRGESSGPLLDAESGRQIAPALQVSLAGTPRILKTHLFSANGEIDAQSWGLLVFLAFLLANVYAAAAIMALFMIIGLSRAVNRLSKATNAVRHGDFSARIPVRRRDQIGELQRTFNEMALNLQTLVAASAQKELLEKELALARDLQNSLIPSNLPNGEGVEFATLFEPSAAIGGDYFDVLRVSPRELAVIIADVSGHGLSTGLRMAMLKAALLILIEQTRDPEEILLRLDAVVRANSETRFFVTATLATFDVRLGRLSLTNAGHPPTYVVRAGGDVEEIMLPSSPLGGLGHSYVRRDVQLERGDIVVWLSDGLFEGVDENDEPFGYDRVKAALTTPLPTPGAGGRDAARAPRAAGDLSAARVRDRLLAAVAAHVGELPPTDDRTLVVMRWLGPVTVAATAEAPAEATVP